VRPDICGKDVRKGGDSVRSSVDIADGLAPEVYLIVPLLRNAGTRYRRRRFWPILTLPVSALIRGLDGCSAVSIRRRPHAKQD